MNENTKFVTTLYKKTSKAKYVLFRKKIVIEKLR